MQTFFTSDTHFDDQYAIQYFNRPFKSVDEMNAVMVEKWNRVVTEQDAVYHLGDFTLDDIGHFTKWASQLKGTIKILPGSHDQPWLKDFTASERIQVIAPWVSVEFPEMMAGNPPGGGLMPLLHAGLGSVESWLLAFVWSQSWKAKRYRFIL